MIPISEELGNADGRLIYKGDYLLGLRPDPNLKVSEWADQHRQLTSRSSSEPGPWRTERTPYLKEIMDALSPSSKTEMVVLMSGAQVGKTECGNNWIGFIIHLAPGPMLAVQPTIEMAQRNSKQRIAPLIEDCEPLKALVRNPRSRDSGNTVLAKEFPGGILVMTGANSAKGLRSMPARYLFLDEVDGYVGNTDGEGEPCALAIARTATFARKKILITSTPIVSGLSRVERFFMQGDQCYYYVPCPYCWHMQTLRFENLRWPKRDPKKAHYLCENCEQPIQNDAKNFMLTRGEWRPTILGTDKRVRSFQLSSLYSPAGWKSWGRIAQEHEEAEGSPEKLQVFWNTVLGLPWTDEGEVPDVDRLYERRELYPIGVVPYGGLVLTAGADVQARRIEVEIVSWGRNRESWSVDYRVLDGATDQPEIWNSLATLLDEEFETAYGNPLRIAKLAVDTGFNTSTVYDFMRRLTMARVMGVKGNTSSSNLVNVPSVIEVTPQGRRMPPGIRLWPINVNIGKEQLYRWLKSSVPDEEDGELWPTGFCHFPQYGKEYFEQLCAERLVMRVKPGGFKQPTWEKIRDRNEALDCRLYALAAAAAMRLDTWRPERWDSIEKDLTVAPIHLPPAQKAHRQINPPSFRSFGAKESLE